MYLSIIHAFYVINDPTILSVGKSRIWNKGRMKRKIVMAQDDGLGKSRIQSTVKVVEE